MKSSNAKHHDETTKALSNIHDKIQNMTAFLKPKVSNTAQQPTFKAHPAGPAPRGPTGPSRLPGRSHESQSTQSSSEETNSHPAQPMNICSKKKTTPYLEKPKVLYIGDSVAHNANFAHIEKDTKSRITVKSYRSCPMLLQLLERKRRKKMNLTI